ncbi:hypothetical protein [Tenacibaculum aiptasiae]|uniref:hypothetical protein n=1 Tax=Tenacibaculum aiptasiae TaxID=426481 RepID=UPI00232E7861|nr:hypothetical protein [Tenacibaculum aiptasiae]
MKEKIYTVLLFACFITSCKPLENIINKKLPQLSTTDQQVHAIHQSSINVNTIKPSAGVFISSKMIQEFLPAELNKAGLEASDTDFKIKEINSSVLLAQQAIILNADFSMDFTTLDVNITGKMSGIAGLSSLKDSLYIYGAFNSLQVEKIRFLSKKPKISNRAKAKLIRPILKHYLKNVNRILFKEPMQVYTGLNANLTMNVKELFNDPKTTIVSSPTNTLHRRISDTSFLIDEKGIRVLLEFSSDRNPSQEEQPNSMEDQSYSKRELRKKFESYFSKYNQQWLHQFDSIEDGNNLVAYISKSEIASLFNEAMAGQIKLTHSVDIPESNATSRLEVPKQKIDCDQLRKPFSYPSFNARNCSWNCTRVISTWPVRITIQDPACVASRDLCKVQRETERVAWQAGREAARVLRQAENEASVLACNVAREANNFMNLGKAKTKFSGNGLMNLSISNISFKDDLNSLTLTQSGNLGLKFNSKIQLHPQDLGYVFLCFTDYSKTINGSATAQFPVQTVTIDFNALHKADKLVLTATPSSLDYRAKINPIPSLELLNDIEFKTKCTFLAGVIGIAAATSFTDLVKYDTKTELFLQGWAKGSYEVPSFSKTIDPILFTINGGESRKAIPVWSAKSIRFSYN